MSLIHRIEAELLAKGATDIELRQYGTGGRALKATFTLQGKPEALVVEVPNIGRRK